jgi:hypothetical protein
MSSLFVTSGVNSINVSSFRTAATFVLAASLSLVALPAAAVPVINSISIPNASTSGGTGTLTGSDFGTFSDAATVTVGSNVAPIISRTPTQIDFVLPEYLSGPRSVAAAVTINGFGSNNVLVNYNNPSLTSFSPVSASIAGGAIITIFGSDFGLDVGSTSLTIGGLAAAVNSMTQTSLTAFIPAYAGGNPNNLEIEAVFGGIVTSLSGFSYESAPVIHSVTPSSGPGYGGNSMVITGLEFDPFAPIVTIGGVQASVISSSFTEITVTVPAGMGSNQPVIVGSANFGSVSSPVIYSYDGLLPVTEAPSVALVGFGLVGLGLLGMRRKR